MWKYFLLFIGFFVMETISQTTPLAQMKAQPFILPVSSNDISTQSAILPAVIKVDSTIFKPKNVTESSTSKALIDLKNSSFNTSSTSKSSQNVTTDKAIKASCNVPNPSSADPERCCSFPDLFPDKEVDQCEKEFGINVTVLNNELLADSVSTIR